MQINLDGNEADKEKILDFELRAISSRERAKGNTVIRVTKDDSCNHCMGDMMKDSCAIYEDCCGPVDYGDEVKFPDKFLIVIEGLLEKSAPRVYFRGRTKNALRGYVPLIDFIRGYRPLTCFMTD